MTSTVTAAISNNAVVAQVGGVDQKVVPVEPSAADTVAEKIAEAVEQAGLAYQFSPGSYTMSALAACVAARAALNDVVVMPKDVYAAVEVLIETEFLINEFL